MLGLNLIHISNISSCKHVVRYVIGIAVDVLTHNYIVFKVKYEFSEVYVPSVVIGRK